MRLLHRDEDVSESDARQPTTDRRGHDASDDTTRRPSRWAAFRRDHDPDRATVAERDAARARDERASAAVAERDRQDRVDTHMKRWDTFGFLTAGAAVALAVFGGLALVRAGVDDTWYSPVVEVAQIDHTAGLGAIEVGVAALVLLPLVFGLRMIAALVAIAGGVVAAVAAIDPDRVSADLALERGWAVGLAVAGIALGLLLVATRDRVKRVERRPARADRRR
ncbi:MAG TPA: hypothetical protein VJM49_02055, partial [Acidimicrobiales bacterium]|nr:hypothetical protein [Acidimicrobiales bacterium]